MANEASSLAHIEKPKPVGKDDRLMSCPDRELHTEEDICKHLMDFFQFESSSPASDPLLHRFDAKSGLPPKISVEEYILRIVKYLHAVANGVKEKDGDVHGDLPARYLVATIIYLDRIRAKAGLKLTPLNSHRLILAGVLVAAKVLDDLQPGLSWFAELGGLDADELKKLEVCFLEAIDYKVTIDAALFAKRYRAVLGRENAKEFDLFSHRRSKLIEAY